jgi:hypothetical protein
LRTCVLPGSRDRPGSRSPRVPRLRPPATPGSRMVRVFVSSTFRDMQTERDELVKRVFPGLRMLCVVRWDDCGRL